MNEYQAIDSSGYVCMKSIPKYSVAVCDHLLTALTGATNCVVSPQEFHTIHMKKYMGFAD